MSSMSSSTPKSETMPRAEVEQLLAAVEDEQKPAAESLEPAPSAEPAEPAAPVAPVAPGSPARLDIPAASFFSEQEFRTLRARHEDYVRSLAGRLSGHLRVECGLQMTKLETVRFKAFLGGLSDPTHLAVFKLEPLNAVCLLNLPPKLALSLVDRELGGPGTFQDEPRELTKMETRLVSRVTELIATEWCGAWSEKAQLKATLSGCETSPRFVRTLPPEQMLVLLSMELRFGELVEQVRMVFPLPVIEQLVGKSDAERRKAEAAAKPPPAPLPKWNAAMDDLTVRLTAEWHGVEVTARQLGELKPGDVLAIAPGTAEQIQVLLEAVPKYSGSLGTAGANWAIKIAEVL